MVQLQVDMERRAALQRLHTATHVMNYAARKVLGHHVWQNGSQLKPEFGTLDITHYALPDTSTLAEMEREANAVVFAKKSVKIEEVDRAEAERRYGYVIYQGGAVPASTLRIVHVDGDDVEACGGLHVRNTEEIGLIKLIDVQKIQDGVIRLKYCVREYALAYVQEQEGYLKDLEELFSVERAKVPDTAGKFFSEWKEQRKEIERLEERLIGAYVSLYRQSEETAVELEEDLGMKALTSLFEQVISHKNQFRLETGRFVVMTPNQDPPASYKKALQKTGYHVYIK